MVSITGITHRVKRVEEGVGESIMFTFSSPYGKPVDVWACGCM